MLALDYSLDCHKSGTVCASVSHRSGQYLASAGKDKEVSIWGWHNTNALHHLVTQFTPESLCFGRVSEHLLAIGSPSGSIKIMDMNKPSAGAINLSGHRGPVRSITQLSPFLWASGSVDCAVKIWDARQRPGISILHMNEHSKTVNSVSCSPDGHWIISASDDCTVKVWDMNNNQVLRTIKDHSAPVTSAITHPHQYLLATGSLDKTVRFWDLETYECVSQSDTAAGPVQSICFHPDGSCLMAAGEKLRFLGWEPAVTYNSLCLSEEISGKMIAMGVQQSTDISICLTTDKKGNGLHVYSVDIQSLRPFSPSEEDINNGDELNELDSVSSHITNTSTTSALSRGKMRRSFTGKDCVGESASESDHLSESSNETSPVHQVNQTNKDKTTAPNKPMKEVTKTPARERRAEERMKKEKEVSISETVNVNIPPEEAFKSKPKVSRSPTRDPIISINKDTIKTDDRFGKTYTVVQMDKEAMPNPPPLLAKKSPVPQRKLSNASKGVKPSISREASVEESLASVKAQPNTPVLPSPINSSWKGRGCKVMATVQPQVHNNQRVVNKANKLVEKVPPFRLVNTVPKAHAEQGRRDSANNLNVDDFLPPVSSSISPCSSSSPKDCINEVNRVSNSMQAIMIHRTKSVRLVHQIWRTQGARDAINSAISSNDQSLFFEVLRIINSKGNCWTLDLSTLLLPHIRKLLESNFSTNSEIAAESVRGILRAAGPLIKSNMARPPSIGVDVNMENRTSKCRTCVLELQSITESLKLKSTNSSSFVYKELGMQIMQFLQ